MVDKGGKKKKPKNQKTQTMQWKNPNHAVEKSLSTNGADISDVYLQKNEIRFLPFTVDQRSQFKT